MRNLFQFIIFLFPFTLLYGEIQQVDITWNAFKCQSTCVQQLKQLINGIQGVKNLNMNGDAGSATMGWEPTIPLSYEPFRYASAGVGIKISTMRIRAKGTIQHEPGNIYFISDRDGTRFHLIGPINIEPGRYIPKYSLDTHPLPQEMAEKLLEIERQGRHIVISGPLFLPSNYPLTLVIEQIKNP